LYVSNRYKHKLILLDNINHIRLGGEFSIIMNSN